MVNIRVAAQTDLPFLREHDSHVAAEELASVVQRGRILIAEDNGNPIGWLRWGLFWDEIPFMNMLTVLSSNRGQGIGRALVTGWEKRMSRAGHSQVLTSTLADESARTSIAQWDTPTREFCYSQASPPKSSYVETSIRRPI